MMPKAQQELPKREVICPSLPPEVWINIFSYHTDLAHLWNVCRRVSSTLSACAEYAFAEYFLRDVQIDFQLEKYNLGGKSRRPEVPVRFVRLGKREEKETAWFADTRAKSELCPSKQYAKVMTRWEENVNTYRPEMPNYTISICGLVNDTALPGLQIDLAKREVRFSWREALHLFYREQARFQSLKEDWQVRTAAKIRRNNSSLAKGIQLMPADYPQPWATAEAEIRKQIRRARLKEAYQGDEQMLWAIDSLKHFEQYGAASGNAKALKVDPDLPGAGLGEKWFGRVNLVQELYLDEWSCMHRVDTKIERLRSGG